MSDNMLDKVLTRREREIMDLLYAEPNLCVSDVNSRLADGSTYSATRAALSRLIEKGQLQYDKQGSRFIYQPVADHRSAGQSAVRRVMDTFFGGSPVATIDAVLGFSSHKLSDSERQQIMHMLAAEKSGSDS